MFRDQGGSYNQKEFNELAVFPIVSGKKVFAKPMYADYITAVERVVNIKPELFQLLYVDLLRRYATYVQALSVPRDKLQQSLLDRSLRRALGVVRHCAPKVIANNGFGYDVDRLIYALFSATLLSGIGRAFQDRRVLVCETDGKYVKTWFPNSGLIQGSFYRVRAIASQDEAFVKQMHLVYAQVVMPEVGMSWLTEEPFLFLAWVNALSDVQSGFSELEVELDVEKLAKGVGEDMDFEQSVVSQVPPELMEGEAFLAWLKEKIRKDSSLINKDGSGLHHADQGLLVELDQLVETYRQGLGKGVSAKDIKGQFMQLGVASDALSYGKVGGSQFFGRAQKSGFEAVLIDRDQGLFESGSLGPVVQVSSQAQLSSGERFFSRVGGLAQQFMLAHSSSSQQR